jgi:hypothetical protein
MANPPPAEAAEPTHDFNRCVCEQWGRCLVHCSTCHCGEGGRHVYVGDDRYRWVRDV